MQMKMNKENGTEEGRRLPGVGKRDRGRQWWLKGAVAATGRSGGSCWNSFLSLCRDRFLPLLSCFSSP